MASVINPKMTINQIQNILNKGGDIKFTKGNYSITKTLILESDSNIILEDGAILKRNKRCYVFQTSVDDNTTKYNGVHNVTITGGTILCDGCLKPSNIISLVHSKDITIKNLTIKNNVGNHAIEINSSKNIVIDSCKFLKTTQQSGACFREQIQIDFAYHTGLPFSKNKNAKTYDGTCCKNVTIQNCTFNGCNIAIGTHTQSATNNHHSNIKILNNKGKGCGVLEKLGAFCRLIGMKKVVISGNEIKNFGRLVEINTPSKFYLNNSSTTTSTNGIDGCSDIDIYNNKIIELCNDFKYNGIYVNSKLDGITHEDIRIGENKLNGALNKL